MLTLCAQSKPQASGPAPAASSAPNAAPMPASSPQSAPSSGARRSRPSRQFSSVKPGVRVSGRSCSACAVAAHSSFQTARRPGHRRHPFFKKSSSPRAHTQALVCAGLCAGAGANRSRRMERGGRVNRRCGAGPRTVEAPARLALVGLDAQEVRAQAGADDPRVAGHRDGVEVEGPPARGAHLAERGVEGPPGRIVASAREAPHLLACGVDPCSGYGLQWISGTTRVRGGATRRCGRALRAPSAPCPRRCRARARTRLGERARAA